MRKFTRASRARQVDHELICLRGLNWLHQRRLGLLSLQLTHFIYQTVLLIRKYLSTALDIYSFYKRSICRKVWRPPKIQIGEICKSSSKFQILSLSEGFPDHHPRISGLKIIFVSVDRYHAVWGWVQILTGNTQKEKDHKPANSAEFPCNWIGSRHDASPSREECRAQQWVGSGCLAKFWSIGNLLRDKLDVNPESTW